MMTREDMLRELELLPVWQLRAPLPLQVPSQTEPATLMTAEDLPINIEQIESVTILTSVSDAVAESKVVESEIVESVVKELLVEEHEAIKSQAFTHIASEDGHCLFVLPNVALQADEAQLMQNICKAMCMHVKPVELSVITVDVIQTTQPKLIIAMGEATVQTLLQSTITLASLRGKLQKFQGIALVSTYDLAHLLQNLPDKAKAWDDLRLAMQALQDIKL
jgi:uracil-DNA glycosylase